MSKKLILALVAVVFLFKFGLAEAEVIINEIKYSPTTKQWVEIYNDGNDVVDLTQYKILDAGAAVNGHSISLCSKQLSPHSYAIIAKVPEDFSGSVFTLCKSPLGIKSTADDTVVLKIGSSSIDTVSVPEGSAVNGNSLQLIGSSWTGATPTPGEENQPSSNNSDEEENISNDEKEEIPEPKKQAVQKLQKSKVQIVSTKLAYVGVPFPMEGSGTGILGEKLTRGVYYWNFDDGDFREVKAVIKDKFTHTYFYPGDYNVTFEYYPNVFTDTPDATTEITIKVLEPKILISGVGEASDFFIEIENVTGHEANLSNWVLGSDYKVFTLPKNTTLSSNKKMIISPRVSHFSIEDKSSLKLMTPEREVVFEYMSSAVPQAKVTVKKSSSVVIKEEQPLIAAKDLTAASILGQSKKDSNSSSSFSFIIFLLFMGASVGGVYFIRRHRKMSPTPADDFEILDE
ncbi:hypothetical protein A2356_03925 [Candidatus Nomurabacteria bacterium RIFOXYB1_FULL_39_16]|uniref:PKD domain-containing protein n=2 Tax=Candidatus Nomuraibacteriota TaxID=1752729 RepID=A0A0G0QZY7_9BACT|nr:MAG: hypothetical protein UT78_C0009G0016 [Candidatus Nomurabacteria bacterium GW2011_GWF2_40_12]OGJ09666.1 MAG: hypothetical protein A2356_03925 [Candidatus Nomurabacteria bacterium RIFOXYB1_FULL_39_16]OGJ15583.1 MAG: hypothetical protein A2585_02210 [Candidatus Nomurabacteria bacterium RIFOXYD1_FULL_39_12]